MDSPMSVMPIVVDAGPLRYSEHALDAASNAADHAADNTAHGSSDWACRTGALRDAFLCAANNSLSLRCYRHGKNGEREKYDLLHDLVLHTWG